VFQSDHERLPDPRRYNNVLFGTFGYLNKCGGV
jgi:hypothetical protein